jgi:hypothetical protein
VEWGSRMMSKSEKKENKKIKKNNFSEGQKGGKEKFQSGVNVTQFIYFALPKKKT